MVAEYAQNGAWEAHIRGLRTLYQTRRDGALSALARYMPSEIEWTQPQGGFFLWLRLPAHLQAQDVKQLALQRGLAITAGNGFFVNPADGSHHLRLTYSCASPVEIDRGIQILAQLIREHI
jgi:2-aminoadipate transaminase